MPVQFRCTSCRGKLSISRRKAGTEVACPKCSKILTVPTGEAMADELTELLSGARSAIQHDLAKANSERRLTPASQLSQRRMVNLDEMPLFERPDFEKLLDPSLRTPDPVPLPLPDESEISDRRKITTPTHDPDAIVISRTTATLLVVAVVVLLGVAFAAGFLLAN